MDIEKSVAYLDAHAQKNCLGHRAEYVRKAVEVGGVHLKCHTSAKDYAPASRRSVSRPCRVRRTRPARWPSSSLFPHIRTSAHPHGPMTVFDGEFWISDFKRLHGLYPGASYRTIKPAFTVYRYARVTATVSDGRAALAFA